MSFFEIEFTLPEQDSYLVEIDKQIQIKRKFLLERRHHLEKASQENKFLTTVKNDYQKYQNYILKQKQEQIGAMNTLDQYLDDLIVTGKMTQSDIDQSKKDKREILGEISKIKKDLDDLMK